jgi:hypothetical protein
LQFAAPLETRWRHYAVWPEPSFIGHQPTSEDADAEAADGPFVDCGAVE